MIFYCTTQIDGHHKIGISSSLSGVKKRLTTYRSAAPHTKILFFTEVLSAEELERSFKNKFSYQRIGRSECYNLRADIIFSHVLRFIHRDELENVIRKDKFIRKKTVTYKRLFSIWRKDCLYVSNYYLDQGYESLDFLGNRSSKDFKYEYNSPLVQGYELSDNQIYRWHMLDNFFPLCHLREDFKFDKKNNIIEKSKKYILYFVDLSSKKKFSEFKVKKATFIRKYYEQKTYKEQSLLFNKFIEDNYKKRSFKSDNVARSYFKDYIYDCIKKNFPNLVKGYKYKAKNIYGYSMSNAHKSLPFSRKIRSFFRNTNQHQHERALRFSISKASYYSIDEFVKTLRELSDLPPIDHFNINNKKIELFQRIRRILLANKREAFKLIDKAVEEFKKEND